MIIIRAAVRKNFYLPKTHGFFFADEHISEKLITPGNFQAVILDFWIFENQDNILCFC